MSFLQEIVYFLTIRPRLNKLRKLLPEAKIHPAGSRYVCNPPVMSTDTDFLIYTEVEIDNILLKNGYDRSNFCSYQRLSSWRKGAVNLVVISTYEHAVTFQTATHISKEFNISSKNTRVLVHELLRGNKNVSLSWFDNLELQRLLTQLSGMHRWASIQAYRAKHGLTL